MKEPKFEDRVAEVERALNTLSELFDTVQIFVNSYEPGEDGGTGAVSRGRGNYYARFGQIHEWLLKKDVETELEVIHEDEEE